MKKLKIKVFATIFTILSLFILGIFIFNVTNNYYDHKRNIEDTLKKMSLNIEPNNNFEKRNPINDNIRKIFLDFTIYTIILDENGNYKEIINHTNDEIIDEDKIKEIATDIINNHTNNLYIGNLYTNKYAYSFTKRNTLIIMNNTNINNELVKYLSLNIISFLLIEFMVIILTYFLTKWIIVPVKNTFEKQKRFIADASHELKTPLSVMIASADAYFNDKDDKWVYNMKNESERMIKLVTDLLNLAASENTNNIIKKEEDLSNIIESSILTFESIFYENKIKLNYNIDKNIKLYCNEDQIKELMSILIDNAIKYSKLNGKVTINLYKTNKLIILEVKNKGLEIKKDDEEKIFERFYKVDSSRNRNNNNYGLGLAIAKNIVENHNGNISASSKDGITTFKVIWNQL